MRPGWASTMLARRGFDVARALIRAALLALAAPEFSLNRKENDR